MLVFQRIYDGFDKEIKTVGIGASGLDSNIYNPEIGPRAEKALITVEGDAVRYWFDGSTPTASEGHLVAVAGVFEVMGGANIAAFKVIRVTGDATIMISYMR